MSLQAFVSAATIAKLTTFGVRVTGVVKINERVHKEGVYIRQGFKGPKSGRVILALSYKTASRWMSYLSGCPEDLGVNDWTKIVLAELCQQIVSCAVEHLQWDGVKLSAPLVCSKHGSIEELGSHTWYRFLMDNDELELTVVYDETGCDYEV